MVEVRIWGSLKAAAGGREILEVEASTIREMLLEIAAAYPRLKPQIDRGVSVSVDGTIYRDAWLTPLSPDSEVVLLPRLAGG